MDPAEEWARLRLLDLARVSMVQTCLSYIQLALEGQQQVVLSHHPLMSSDNVKLILRVYSVFVILLNY